MLKIIRYMNLERLKELRKEKNLTQPDIAQMLGISATAYSKYELGKSKPDIDSLVKLSKFYEVSLDYIVGLTDIKRASVINENFAKADQQTQEIIEKILFKLTSNK